MGGGEHFKHFFLIIKNNSYKALLNSLRCTNTFLLLAKKDEVMLGIWSSANNWTNLVGVCFKCLFFFRTIWLPLCEQWCASCGSPVRQLFTLHWRLHPFVKSALQWQPQSVFVSICRQSSCCPLRCSCIEAADEKCQLMVSLPVTV